jgi:MFS family permease
MFSRATIQSYSRGTKVQRSFARNKLASRALSSSSSTSSFFDTSLESNVADANYEGRWKMIIPAVCTHLCLGSPWAWSLVADSVTRELGFVAPAANDWSLYECAAPLSMIFLTQGVIAGMLGKWQIKVGMRRSLLTSAFVFGGGILAGAYGIHTHNMPLLYGGYGLMGGAGMGLAYTPPIAAVMSWYPERKALVSGLCVGGYGAAALIFTPAMQTLMKYFAIMPQYMGKAGEVPTYTIDGKLYCNGMDGSDVIECVKAGATELAKLPYDLPEGIYAVGTGSTGVAPALAIMGLTYFTVIAASAFTIKNPHPEYVSRTTSEFAAATIASTATTTSSISNEIDDEEASMRLIEDNNNTNETTTKQSNPVEFTVEQAIATKQFYLLGTCFFCLCTGGFGIASVAKPMVAETFSVLLPTVVTSAFAAKFILMLSTGNLSGRILWAVLSEKIGRPSTFNLFTIGSVPIYFALPALVDSVVTTGNELPLYAFCGGSALALSYMGGVFAILPAYQSDLYGAKYVSAIHGKMMLFASAAALTGPALISSLRYNSEMKAMNDLMELITPNQFQDTFGVSIDKANELIVAKSLSISRLMEIVPEGTIDPSPHLYDSTMQALTGLMAVSVVSHLLVKPINSSQVKQIMNNTAKK